MAHALVLCSVAVNWLVQTQTNVPTAMWMSQSQAPLSLPVKSVLLSCWGWSGQARQVWGQAEFTLLFPCWVCWIWAGLGTSSAAQEQGI